MLQRWDLTPPNQVMIELQMSATRQKQQDGWEGGDGERELLYAIIFSFIQHESLEIACSQVISFSSRFDIGVS